MSREARHIQWDLYITRSAMRTRFGPDHFGMGRLVFPFVFLVFGISEKRSCFFKMFTNWKKGSQIQKIFIDLKNDHEFKSSLCI